MYRAVPSHLQPYTRDSVFSCVPVQEHPKAINLAIANDERKDFQRLRVSLFVRVSCRVGRIDYEYIVRRLRVNMASSSSRVSSPSPLIQRLISVHCTPLLVHRIVRPEEDT